MIVTLCTTPPVELLAFSENIKFKIKSDVNLIAKDWFYNQNLIKVFQVDAMNQLYPFIIQFSSFNVQVLCFFLKIFVTSSILIWTNLQRFVLLFIEYLNNQKFQIFISWKGELKLSVSWKYWIIKYWLIVCTD